MKSTELVEKWQHFLVGQNHAIEIIVPYINRYRANLHMPERTVGNFFLVGPTGTGKTKTPETLANVLHGSERSVLKVDCGAFQADHEVAKLIGAPPGYLGHRETVPMLAQAKVNEVASDKCKLSIIIFDEIDKASGSMWRVLLSILDKARLKLGDNSTVNFENCLIFLTSNKGSDKIARELYRGFGFDMKPDFSTLSEAKKKRVQSIGKKATEDGFSPEFFNRIDDTITYNPLNTSDLKSITELELEKIEWHINERLQDKAFDLEYGQDIIDTMARLGTDVKYGARFLKRTIDKMIFNPLCNYYLDNNIQPNSIVSLIADGDTVRWKVKMPESKIVVKGPRDLEAAAYLYESGTP